tara:strand:- start:1109 stop:2983 length:1875 start_codon:yes stop_codon:yes gene_type:complete
MCGILGEFTFDSSLIEKSTFLKLLELSRNRGPDSQKYISNNKNFQFGFNRLSILDITDLANQPIRSHNKRFTMVYNGEIYNYKEIRKILQKNSFNIKSTGDTEVLVNAFSFFGIDETINMLDGMFAIALFDNKNQSINLIRDFAGIKPLYYAFNKNRLVFSSQYNQISNHPSFYNNEIDLQVLKLYLSQHFIPAPFGLLKNSFQLNPGEIITFDMNGNYRKNHYWEFPKYVEPTIFNEGEANEFIRTELENAVKSELVSDVPVGAFLSGGIDSSLICYFAQKNISEKLNTITIGNNSVSHDESKEAKIIIDSIGLNGVIKKIDANIFHALFEEFSNSITEPFADLSLIPAYYASKISKKDFSVALTGDGGDELFFGYERFWSIAKNIKIQNYPYLLKYIRYLYDKIFHDNSNINGVSLFNRQCDAHFDLHCRFKEEMINKIFPYLKDVEYPFGNNNYDYPNTKNEMELIQYMRHAEFYGMMQKTLRKVDQASMANSLELRVPFLKKSFIEASLKIDPYLNYGPNVAKASKKKILLKKIFNNMIPSVQFDEIKRGFSIPLSSWLKHELFNLFQNAIIEKSSINHFDIEKKELTKIIENHKNKDIDHKWPIFTIFALFNWRNNQQA